MYLTLSSNQESHRHTDIRIIGAGSHGNGSGEGVGDGDDIGGPISDGRSEVQRPYDPRRGGLETDVVVEILPSRLITEDHLHTIKREEQVIDLK